MPYTNLDDPRFGRAINLADAYRVMLRFVERYNARGESSTVNLMTDIGLVIRNQSCDPAQLDDFLSCAEEVLREEYGT
jgi:hypothetical protein